MSEEELFPKTTRFEDDSAIIAYSLSNEKYIAKHGTDKYSLKSIFVSNYAPAGGIIKTEPSYCIVVEHPYKNKLTSEDLQNYVIEFVRTILHSNFDENKICHYIGRRNDKENNMVISGKVQREIIDEILEPELEKRRMDRNYAIRAGKVSTIKN